MNSATKMPGVHYAILHRADDAVVTLTVNGVPTGHAIFNDIDDANKMLYTNNWEKHAYVCPVKLSILKVQNDS